MNNDQQSVFFKKSHIIFFWLILFVYGTVFCSISLVNHYNFRTSAYDLGINNNAIYDYAHFRKNDCMIMQPQFENVLSDHFSLYPVFVSPFSWLFGSYTMLVFQIIAILFGGVGIYRLILEKSKNEGLALTAMCHFFSVWGIYSALSFDYHDNVVAAMLVPWLLVFFFRKSWLPFFLLFVLILVGKENMALWVGFIGIGLFILRFKDKASMYVAVATTVLAFVYFIVIVKVVIPSLANTGREYLHFNYSALGIDFEDALRSIFTKPARILELLFANHSGLPYCDTIKTELHVMVFASGGYAFFKKPSFFIMLLPIYAQKMFNDDMTKWGLNGHYSIEFVPIITIALYWWLSESNVRFAAVFSKLALCLCIAATYLTIESRYSLWYNNQENYRFYDKEHYQTSYSTKEIYKQLKLIPDNAAVSAGVHLVPHLAFRDYIYQYPEIGKAEYIVLLNEKEPYPFNQEDLKRRVEELSHSKEWIPVYAKNDLFIFKKATRSN